jgi:hypothetical protein
MNVASDWQVRIAGGLNMAATKVKPKQVALYLIIAFTQFIEGIGK